MPLFEYRCTKCSAEFEELVFGDRTPDCPSCGAGSPEKLLSAHAVGRSGGAKAAPVPAGCGTCGHPGGPGACRN